MQLRCCARLQSLTLSNWNAHFVSIDPALTFATTFVAMRSLHSLRLQGIRHVDMLLQPLAQAPSLRTLTIDSSLLAPLSANKKDDSLPSIPVLTRLLADAPNLRCVIRVTAVRLDPFIHSLIHLSDRVTLQIDEE
jgi:hypothetical protein